MMFQIKGRLISEWDGKKLRILEMRRILDIGHLEDIGAVTKR